MAERVYNKTDGPVGASAGDHYVIPGPNQGQPGYLDLPPKAAKKVVEENPQELTLNKPEALQAQGNYTPGFVTKHFDYVEKMTESQMVGVIAFLSAGVEVFKTKGNSKTLLKARLKQWMVGTPGDLEAEKEKAEVPPEEPAEDAPAEEEKKEKAPAKPAKKTGARGK